MKEREMKRGLKNRHLQMIALGSAIGTGLFYGSASTIQLAGPAVMLAYLLGGIVLFFIMRMLGEMSVDEPVSGSFSYYATKHWGDFAGFFAGWNYWFEYAIVSMAELTAVGIYISFWFPDFPKWLSAFICIVIITSVNLFSVKYYGEVEFWMSFVKVAAIIFMIVLGLYLIFQSPLPFPANFQNLWVHGGFFPTTAWEFSMAVVIVMFSFGGIELIGITAGEAENPEKSLPKAINQVVLRILLFYVLAMGVLMTLWPWKEVGLEASPFVQIFANVGIPFAAHLLNFVVLMAAISVYNSAIYSNSRMLYGLAQGGYAPKIFQSLTVKGVPLVSILVSALFTFLVVILNYFVLDKLFMYLLAIVVGAAVMSWCMIILTHLKFRKHIEKVGKKTKFPAIFYPYANYFCLIFLAWVLFMMTQIEDMQLASMILPLWILFLRVFYQLKKKAL